MRRRIGAAVLAGALSIGGGLALAPASVAQECPPILMFSRTGATAPDPVGQAGGPGLNAATFGCLSDGDHDVRYFNPGSNQVSIATTATPIAYYEQTGGEDQPARERVNGMVLTDAFLVEYLDADGGVVDSFLTDAVYSDSTGRWSTPGYLDMLGVSQVRMTVDIITGQTISNTYRQATAEAGV